MPTPNDQFALLVNAEPTEIDSERLAGPEAASPSCWEKIKDLVCWASRNHDYRNVGENEATGPNPKQWVVCTYIGPDTTTTKTSSVKTSYVIAYIITAGIFGSGKLGQALGQSAYSIDVGSPLAGFGKLGSFVFSWFTLPGGIYVTLITRVPALIEGSCKVWFANDFWTNTEDTKKINDERQTLPPESRARKAYTVLHRFFWFCGCVSVLFKGINAAFSALLLSLWIKGYSPENIKTSLLDDPNSPLMPSLSSFGPLAFAGVIFLMVYLSLCAIVSSICFDILRRLAKKSHDAAYAIATFNFANIKKEKKIWALTAFFSLWYAGCYAIYSFNSTSDALTVLTRFIFGPFGDTAKTVIFLATGLSSITGVLFVLLTAGVDTLSMFNDTLDWSFNNVLKNPLSILACGFTMDGAFINNFLKHFVVIAAFILTIVCGLADLANNTVGVFGTISDYLTTTSTAVKWLLAAPSAISYFANNGWVAFTNILFFLGLLHGRTEIDNDGVTRVRSLFADAPPDNLLEMVSVNGSPRQEETRALLGEQLPEATQRSYLQNFWNAAAAKWQSCYNGGNKDDAPAANDTQYLMSV
jgi:hypothetical protein